MSAQDYGDIADYMLNGDNWTQVTPNGTLVIPGQYGKPPLVPDISRDTYRPIGSDTATCDVGNCALFAHYCTTTVPTVCGYLILKVASFDVTEENCLCALAGEFAGNTADCIRNLQAFVDASDGQTVFDILTDWWIHENGIESQEFTATVLFDFWFVGCYGEIIDIPNLLSSPPATQCVQVGPSCWVNL